MYMNQIKKTFNETCAIIGKTPANIYGVINKRVRKFKNDVLMMRTLCFGIWIGCSYTSDLLKIINTLDEYINELRKFVNIHPEFFALLKPTYKNLKFVMEDVFPFEDFVKEKLKSKETGV